MNARDAAPALGRDVANCLGGADLEPIVGLYAPDATSSTEPFRKPHRVSPPSSPSAVDRVR